MRNIHPTVPGARLGMPVRAWPAHDQIAWAAAFAPPELLDDLPNGSGLRPPTRLALETCYARWLLYLNNAAPEVLAWQPAARATREHLRAYVELLRAQLTSRTVYSYLARLKRALELLAADYDWDWMNPMLRKLNKLACKAGPTRPRPIVPPKELFAFGIRLMKEADEAERLARLGAEQWPEQPPVIDVPKEKSPVERAELYRDGLAIAFLAARPLRLKNVLGLELGLNFQLTASGYGVSLEFSEMKTKAPIAFPVPAKLAPLIRRYIETYRPVLAGGPHADTTEAEALWLARSGRRFPVASFEAMIAKRTIERFDKRLTPHRFRHCAATAIAENNPDEFHIIRVILGHSTAATAEKHYIETRNRQAFRKVQENIIARTGAGAPHRRDGMVQDDKAAAMPLLPAPAAALPACSSKRRYAR